MSLDDFCACPPGGPVDTVECPIHADRAPYVAAVREQAFHSADPDEAARYAGGIVHCFMGAVGADWNGDAVVALIEKPGNAVAWDRRNLFGHQLLAINDDHGRMRRFNFDVTAPEAAAPSAVPVDRSRCVVCGGKIEVMIFRGDRTCSVDCARADETVTAP